MSSKKYIISDFPLFACNFTRIVNNNGGKYSFAEKIGSAYDSVRRWCNGKSLPGGPALLKMHEIYGVSIDWLLTGKSAKGAICPHCGDWPDDIRDLCADVKKILESDDEVVRTALQSNIAAFRQSIEKNKKLQTRPKDKIYPGKGVRDKPLESPADPAPAAKSGVG